MRDKLLFLIILGLFYSCEKKVDTAVINQNIQDIIRRANVIYTIPELQTGKPHVPLMVSNGIVGGCFDHMGSQMHPNYDYNEGRTVLGYIQNYYQHKETTRQIQMPLTYMTIKFADGETIDQLYGTENYKQELDLFTGTLRTQYDLYGKTDMLAFAHQAIPNLFVVKIVRKASSPEKEFLLTFDCELSKEQNNNFQWKTKPLKVAIETFDNHVDITTKTNLTTTHWTVQVEGDCEISQTPQDFTIRLKDESNLIKLLVKREDVGDVKVLDRKFDELLAEHQGEWQRLWQESWVDFPDEITHNVWTRTKYYSLSHFPVIPEKPMIPTGLNTNIWGFTFPQDVYYVADNLPRLGHFDRSEIALQYWKKILPDVKKYARRIMDLEGAYYPWTPPFTNWDDYEKNWVVSEDSYELHNPAYVAAMVWHYYKYSLDKDFLCDYFPIIEEVWRYYSNISLLNDKGRYDVYHEHARGQDEASSREGKLRNLLCASYSAEYSAGNYLKATDIIDAHDEDLVKLAERILAAGYEREVLLKETGIYRSYQGDERPDNRQKHPVQLNPFTYLPMPDLTGENSPAVRAWQHRYELTQYAKQPKTRGWTFGQFIWASARMRSPEDVIKDLGTIPICHGADDRWIQFYESSYWPRWHINKSYYLPMSGLYLQTFTDLVLQDWRGYTDLFPCILPDWEDKDFAFHGIRTLGNVIVDGEWQEGNFNVALIPTHADTQLKLRVSREITGIRVIGAKEGITKIDGNEVYSFQFEGLNTINVVY